MMAEFLITGGAGFFGSILKKYLVQQGHRCVSIDLMPDDYVHENFSPVQGDIRDRKLLEKIFSEHQFKAVFHCAAMLAHVKKNMKDLWSSNVCGTENIADMAEKYGVGKVVFISSNCLWAKSFDYPVTENEPPSPVEIYGKSKLEAEKILMSRKGKFDSVIFRSPTIMDEGRLGLLGILFEFIDENRKLWMVGDGNNVYQFIYAGDLTRACLLAVGYSGGEIFNIGSDDVKTFNEVYSYVIKHSGSSSRLAHFPKWFAIPVMRLAYALGMSPLGPYQYKMIASSFVFDTSKIKEKLGFVPTLKNEEMLLKAYNFYHCNKSEIKRRKNMSAHNVSAKMGIIRLLKWLS